MLLQSASLRRLTLWSIELCAGKVWKDVLAGLRVCESFHLDAFTLKSPYDDDVLQHEEMGEVPVRIPDEKASSIYTVICSDNPSCSA